MRTCLKKAGVEFIDENGGGPGVRLRKRSSGKSRKLAEMTMFSAYCLGWCRCRVAGTSFCETNANR